MTDTTRADLATQLRAISGYPIFRDFEDGAVATTSLRGAAAMLESDGKRIAELEAENERLTKRHDLLAAGFDVPDGGCYIADWQSRIQKYKAAIARAESAERALAEVISSGK